MKVYCWLDAGEFSLEGQWLMTVAETEEEARAYMLAKYDTSRNSQQKGPTVAERFQKAPFKVLDVKLGVVFSLKYEITDYSDRVIVRPCDSVSDLTYYSESS